MASSLRSEKRYQFRWLALGAVFSMVLLSFRIYHSDSITFIFLLWNLFLAGIPWLLSTVARFKSSKWATWKLASVLVFWLAFFPNAPYILTDLVHFKWQTFMPWWYDLSLILSFALTGLMMGLFSLRDVELIIREKWGRTIANWVTAGFLFLAAYGVYLGRFLRWNTWDIVANPTGLFSEMIHQLSNPFTYPRLYGMTLIFGAMLLLCYRFLHRTKTH